MKHRTVILADDHVLFLKGLEELLEKETNIQVLDALCDGEQVVGAVEKHNPDVLILDLNLKTTNGFEILLQLKEKNLRSMVIFLTMYMDPLLIEKAKKLGAQGFLLKETDPAELVEIIGSLDEKSFVLSDKLKQNWLEKEANSDFTDEFETVVKLTARELEILKHIASGKPAKIIAEELFISSATVDTHRKNMMKKMNLNRISELVAYAHRNQIL